MNRRLNKRELELWKAVTKEDIKLKNYISEDMTEKSINVIKKSKSNKNSLNLNKPEVEKLQNEHQTVEKLQVNKRMKLKFERGLIRPEATLDLHGFNRVEAKKILDNFIKACINQEKRCILVVTGKRKTVLGSKSILRELVPNWLNESYYSSLILAHSYAIQRDGGDGARYILLRKKDTIK